MNVAITPHKGGWHVTVQIPEHNKTVEVGHLERIPDGRWRLSGYERQYVFDAESLEAARVHIHKRLQAGILPGEYVREETMTGYVDMNLQTLNALAYRTGSMKGWVAGIGMGIGRFLAEDLPEGNEETFWRQLRDAAESTRDTIKQQEAWREDLSNVIKHMHKAVCPGDDEPPSPLH